MSNITLKVPDDVIKKVRKVALEKNTTLTEMVREFLRSVADWDETEREARAHKLTETFNKYTRDMGGKSWTREELHERR